MIATGSENSESIFGVTWSRRNTATNGISSQ